MMAKSPTIRMPAQTWRIIRDLFAVMPGHAATTIVLLLLAGLAEGIGFITLLPVLSLATGQSTGSETGLEIAVTRMLDTVGLPVSLPVLLTIVVLGVLFKSSLTLLASINIGAASAEMATRFRLDFIRNALRSSWSYFISQPAGRLTNAVSSEASQASAAYGAVTNLAAMAIQVAVVSIVALLTSWQVTVVGLLAGFCMILLLQKLVGIARRAGTRQVELMNVLVAHLADVLALIKPLKAMGQQDRVEPLLASSAEGINRAQRHLQVSTAALSTFQEPLFTIFLALGVYVTLTQTNYTLVDMLFMAILFQRIVVRTGSLQVQYQKMASLEGAYFSMQEAIAAAARQCETGMQGSIRPQLQQAITVENLTLAYAGTPVLQNLSMTIPARSLTALVGPSGAGKTTLVDVIIGLLPPQQGRILIDDVDLVMLDQQAWRSSIGYVPQDLVLLHDTIYANVSLGDPAIGRADAEVALRAAGAWDFVARMPEGLDSMAGERGAKLSGGQRQRISLARALARRPKLLILDEPTTALDPNTEREICLTLRNLTADTTILVISHQTALVDVADHVYRLEAGQISSTRQLRPELA